MYRPDQTPSLLLSPVGSASPTTDEEVTQELVALLREQLDDGALDPQENVVLVPRAILSLALQRDLVADLQAESESSLDLPPQVRTAYWQFLCTTRLARDADALLKPLQQFVTATTWRDARAVLDRHPELLSDSGRGATRATRSGRDEARSAWSIFSAA